MLNQLLFYIFSLHLNQSFSHFMIWSFLFIIIYIEFEFFFYILALNHIYFV